MSRLILCLLCLFLGAAQAAAPAAPAADAAKAGELNVPAVQRTMLALSRRAMTQFLRDGTTLRVPPGLPPILRRRGALFVTVEKRGQITPRGCRGTLQPAYSSLADEIIHNSIAACTRDSRVPPLRLAELPQCRISLSVVLRATPIQSIAEHDATHNGLIAQNGSRIGIVLPYEGRDPNVQLQWARRKAGLNDGEVAQLVELVAVRFRDNS